MGAYGCQQPRLVAQTQHPPPALQRVDAQEQPELGTFWLNRIAGHRLKANVKAQAAQFDCAKSGIMSLTGWEMCFLIRDMRFAFPVTLLIYFGVLFRRRRQSIYWNFSVPFVNFYISMKHFRRRTVEKVLCFSLLLSFSCIRGYSQTQELEQVLNSLSQTGTGLTGYKITALETNFTFNQKAPILEFLTSTNLSRKQIAGLEQMLNNTADTDTNICSYVYRFGDRATSISSQQYSKSGKLIQKNTILVTGDGPREYHNSIEPSGLDGRTNTGWAEKRSGETNTVSEFPVFICKKSLRGFIESASTRTCKTGRSLAGEDCLVVTISGIPHSPIESYKIYFRLGTLTPVEFNSYLANGNLYSRTELRFKEAGGLPLLCKEADAQIYFHDQLFRQSIWRIGQVEKDKTPLFEGVDTFTNLDSLLKDPDQDVAKAPNNAKAKILKKKRQALPADDAAQLAAKLANDQCEHQYRKRPFVATQYAAKLQDGAYRWGGLNVAGKGGFSALVTFRQDGTDPHVEVYFSTDVF